MFFSRLEDHWLCWRVQHVATVVVWQYAKLLTADRKRVRYWNCKGKDRTEKRVEGGTTGLLVVVIRVIYLPPSCWTLRYDEKCDLQMCITKQARHRGRFLGVDLQEGIAHGLNRVNHVAQRWSRGPALSSLSA